MPAVVIPSPQIIGGMGGKILTGEAGYRKGLFEDMLKEEHTTAWDKLGGLPGVDVTQWQLSIRTSLAQCPNTGTFGANCRRIILSDWSFSGTTPVDQGNFPQHYLTDDTGVYGAFSNGRLTTRVTYPSSAVALVFKLGDTDTNPDTVLTNRIVGRQRRTVMTQRYYYAPYAYLQSYNPVLNAAGDVIRMSFSGEGSGHIFLLPNEEKWYTDYTLYFSEVGWGPEA